MKVDSSFFRLFRQSRYSRCIEDKKTEPKQNRRELFSVAAVTFVMKHDRAFARDFLVRVAGVPKPDFAHPFTIKPQADDCADLLISDDVNGQHYVVEFKVHAPTEEHQSPGTKAFTGGRGYCLQIRKRFGTLKNRGLTYTVLSKQIEFGDRMVNGVCCRARTWKELIPKNGRESPLLSDLLDSVGDFGVPVLSLRKIKNMKNARHVQGAFDIHQLLKAVSTDFRESPLDVGADEIHRWCGMHLTVGKTEFAVLRRWLGHQWRRIGWIGYLLPKTASKPELSVWLYFDPKHLKEREESIRLLRKKLPGKTVKESQTSNDLIVAESAGRVRDEKKWFSETLLRVLASSTPILPRSNRP